MCLSLLLLSLPSFAGQWVVTFTGTGTLTGLNGVTTTCSFTNSQYSASENPYHHLVALNGNSNLSQSVLQTGNTDTSGFVA